MIFYVPDPQNQTNEYSERVKKVVASAEKDALKLTGRGKQTFFCPACMAIRPQRGRKHIAGRAICAECANHEKAS
jgi:hypothetical protein